MNECAEKVQNCSFIPTCLFVCLENVRLELPLAPHLFCISLPSCHLPVHKIRTVFSNTAPPYMGRNPSFCRTISIIFLNICMSSVNTVFLISSSSLVGNILVGITFSCVSLLFFNAFDRSAFLVLRNEIRRNRHLVVVRSVKFICGQQQASLLSSSCWGFTLAGMLLLLLLSWWLLVTVAVFYAAWLLQSAGCGKLLWGVSVKSRENQKAFSSVFFTQEL